MAEVRAHQARRPVLDEGPCVRPDPWHSLSVIVDPDARSGSASQLEGEKNIHSPSGGRELHAAPSTAQNYSSSFSPFPSDAIARENPRERAPPPNGAPLTSALNHRNCRTAHNEDLQEARGEPSVPGDSPVFLEDIEPFGLARAAENADVGGVQPLGIDAYGRGGIQPVADAAPALAESTSGIGLAGEAE